MASKTKQIIGYSNQISVEPGQRVQFMVSCTSAQYRADVVRLIHGDPHSEGPGRKEELIDTPVNENYQGRKQEIRTGSYVIIDASLPGDLSSLTIQAWIHPTLPDQGDQGLLTKWDAATRTGFGLFIGSEGDLVFRIGDGNGTVQQLGSKVPLQPRQWYFVAAVLDGPSGHMRLHQDAVAPWAAPESSIVVEKTIANLSAAPASRALLMAATWDGSRVVNHYDGKIDGPRIFNRALVAEEIDLLRRGRCQDVSEATIASWDFSLDISSAKVSDTGLHQLHGRTVNCPARAVTGHNWTGKESNWTHCPEQYGSIHFHRDDLEDAEWEVDFELTVPEHVRSGVYAARLVTDSDEDRIPFFVRPKHNEPTADIVFLAPTLTYLAYANEATVSVSEARHVGKLFEPKCHEAIDQYVADNNMRSLYDRHLDATGVCYASWRRPQTVRPDHYGRFRGYAHGLSADLHILDWLEVKGFTYDVVTDHDLHEQGAELLSRYRVVITGGHPEYWTGQMLDALEVYQQGGGRLMYVGGNGFWGVVSVNPERPYLVELRRIETNGFVWQSPPGEFYSSLTGEQSGGWTSRGRSPRQFSGVGCTSVGTDQAMPYRRQEGSFDPRAAFIFEGIADEELIGNFGLQQKGAGGDETDRLDYALGTPPHALLLATASGFSDVYLYIPEDVLYDQLYPTDPSSEGKTAKAHPHVRADMVFYELPKEGAVFSTGSITWCGALSHNNYENNVSLITQNVLRRFLDPTPIR